MSRWVLDYRVVHVAKLFDISHETVRKWALEFERHLSPTANPGGRKHRLFTDEDMKVLALVSELKAQNYTYSEIHVQLDTGERGAAPLMQPDEVQRAVSAGHESRLELEIERMQVTLIQAEEALRKAQKELLQMDDLKEQKIRLETQLAASEQNREKLESQVEELHQRIEQVSREIGEAYAKGYIEALNKPAPPDVQ